MSDHIDAVRAQAEREAEYLYPKPHREPKNVNQRASNTIYAAFRDGYVRGQVDLASRLTRESIAEELSKHHFIHGIGRSNSCHCGVQVGEFAEYRNHEADAILALFTEDLRAVDQ